MAELRLRLLGETRLERHDEALNLGSERQRRLLVALALAGPRGLPVETLVDRVWDEGDAPTAPVPTLRTYVNRLRGVVGDAQLIDTMRGGYALSGEVALDVEEFERLVALSRGTDDPHEERRRALQLWDGPALAGFSHLEWARPVAVRLEEQRLDVTEKVIESLIARGAYREAATRAEPLVDDHPYRESLLELRMIALYGDNRQTEALRAYDDHLHRMVDDLGVYPSTALQTLNQRILDQDPTLDVAATPAAVWRRHRMLVVAATVAVTVIVIAAATALLLRDRANDEEVAAVERGAESQRIMAVAASVASRDAELALLLAAEAQRLSPDAPVPFEVVDLIGSELGGSRLVATFDSDDHGYERVRYADVSSDGSLVLIGDHDSFRLLDVAAGSEMWRVSSEGEGWFWFGYLANDERSVAIHRHHAASDLTSFFYTGSRLRPDSTSAGVEIYSIVDGTLEASVPIAETCPSNAPAPSDFIDASGTLVGYVDQGNGACLEFGAYEVVVADIESGDERYRSRSELGSVSPFLTFGGERAVWFDADRGAHIVVDLATGREVTVITADEGWSKLSPNGELIAIVPGSEGAPLVFDVATGQLVDRLTGVATQVFGVWWDATSTRLFAAARGTLASWDVSTGEMDVSIADPQGETGQGGVSIDGGFAAAVVADTDLVRLWSSGSSAAATAIVSTSVGLPGSVRSLSSAGDLLLAAVGWADRVPVWGVGDRAGFTEVGHGASPFATPAGQVLWQRGDELGLGPLVAGTLDGEVETTFEAMCWSRSVDGLPPTCRSGEDGAPGRVGAVAVSTNGDRVAALVTTAGRDFVADTSVYVWDADGRLLARSQAIPIAPDSHLAWIDAEAVVTTGGWIVEASTGGLSRHAVDVTALAVGEDGVAYAGDASGSIHRLDRGQIATNVHAGGVTALAVGADGSVASYGEDEMLVLVEVATGTATRRIRARAGGAALAWTGPTTVALAAGSTVDFLTFEDVELSGVARVSTDRDLTDAECEAYLMRSCRAWEAYVAGT